MAEIKHERVGNVIRIKSVSDPLEKKTWTDVDRDEALKLIIENQRRILRLLQPRGGRTQ